MKLCTAVAALSLATFAATAAAQANNFQLIKKDGKTIGKATYTIDKTKDGYKIKARYEYRFGGSSDPVSGPDPNNPSMSAMPITEAQMSSEAKIDANGNYISGFVQNSADQTITSFSPSKTRNEMIIAQTQGGTGLGSKTVAMPKPDFLVAPDYDPGAMQVLLTGALTHPHSDHLYLLVVPGAGNKGTQALYITIADPTDATGALDGKPVTLKQYALGWNQSKGALYTDADGKLMQVNSGPTGASYIRNGFKLDAKPAE